MEGDNAFVTEPTTVFFFNGLDLSDSHAGFFFGAFGEFFPDDGIMGIFGCYLLLIVVGDGVDGGGVIKLDHCDVMLSVLSVAFGIYFSDDFGDKLLGGGFDAWIDGFVEFDGG